mmetsp:Transcript_2964/g.8540  ORF Transcript_2964/g.8540 Transcript_2964/m.8540 type:complete len:230 (-) Transcript_2964:283-972(-)
MIAPTQRPQEAAELHGARARRQPRLGVDEAVALQRHLLVHRNLEPEDVRHQRIVATVVGEGEGVAGLGEVREAEHGQRIPLAGGAAARLGLRRRSLPLLASAILLPRRVLCGIAHPQASRVLHARLQVPRALDRDVHHLLRGLVQDVRQRHGLHGLRALAVPAVRGRGATGVGAGSGHRRRGGLQADRGRGPVGHGQCGEALGGPALAAAGALGGAGGHGAEPPLGRAE